MELSNAQRAEILVQALPYIQKYYNKIIVIKYGGNAMLNCSLKKSVMRDIVLLSLIGIKVVLVHGGGPEISDMLSKTGKESKFIGGLRVTDEETMDIVQMVLAGKINKELVSLINSIGGKAIGLSGIDGAMIEAQQLSQELGFVGEIVNIDAKIINDVLEKGYIPVVSSIGYDRHGNSYNINADTAAAEIASSLKATSFILMTDTVGLLRDKNDAGTLIPKVSIDEAPELIKSGIISDGMLPKVSCCINAVEKGVERVFIIDGRVPHSILIEVLTDKGIGTMFYKQ
ncbi:MAG TPA: acetylglutamate kinase [Clostridiales bacterium]|jgi:acetylglutamate kinase|nr:acetylglutamate kinase [Clostridiales bacterium]HOJ35091.1 acetylglutamate kinase [Clostridiales bacterium]HPU66935.1 acetylglutamate kinase [Clostridiales bacterium]HQA06321.1 acetylglutamate kinase [Clostridiales bacterium]HQD72681.1 acetylglutamate kinase [Clostridiales bacterium]